MSYVRRERTSSPQSTFDDNLKKLGDGEFGVVLVRKDKAEGSIEPLYTNAEAGISSLVESLLLKMHRELEKGMERTGYKEQAQESH